MSAPGAGLAGEDENKIRGSVSIAGTPAIDKQMIGVQIVITAEQVCMEIFEQANESLRAPGFGKQV